MQGATGRFRNQRTHGIVRANTLKETIMPTLEQIQAKLKKLQAQAEAMIAKRAQSVLDDIRKLMEKHGLTTADIEAHSSTKKRRGRPAGKSTKSDVKAKAAAKPSCLPSIAIPRRVKRGAAGPVRRFGSRTSRTARNS